jgi:hypothetical protein
MNATLAIWGKVVALVDKLEQLASDLNQNPAASPHDQGFADGLAAASGELRILLAQFNGLPLPSPYELANGDIQMDFRPTEDEEEVELEWEFLYVTFEQTQAGDWMLKDVNGLWHSNWGNAPSFGQAVEQLRNQEGWRLVSFAKGIHIFRRPQRL